MKPFYLPSDDIFGDGFLFVHVFDEFEVNYGFYEGVAEAKSYHFASLFLEISHI